MIVSGPMIIAINNILHNINLHNYQNHFLIHAGAKPNLIIYGTDDPQKAYLARDDMDLVAVADTKWRMFADDSWVANPDDDQRRGKIPVCTSEIRCLVRDWDFFADYVTFCEGFVTVDPPWLRTGTLRTWSADAKHMAQKYVGTVNPPNPVLSFQQAIQAHDDGNYMSAIAAYHAGRPSLFRNKHAVVGNPP